MNFGHIILTVVATVIGYMLYMSIQNCRMKDYFDAHEVSKEARREMERDEIHDRLLIVFRLAIWCTCAVFCLAGGNLLAAILTTVFTVEGVWHIFKEAWDAERSRVSALTCLIIPFGALIMAVCMSKLGIILGILIGLFIVAIPTALNWICRNTTTEE